VGNNTGNFNGAVNNTFIGNNVAPNVGAGKNNTVVGYDAGIGH
jgi:hypothetical protein